MKNIIKKILKEETETEFRKVVKVLKNFIIEYFSEVDWFKGVDFEIGTWFNSKLIPTPEIKITIYISNEHYSIGETEFPELIEEINFIMDMIYPMKDYMYSVVWTMNIKPV